MKSMKSKIATCTVSHMRHKPVKHGFSYPHYVFVLNLDELQLLDSKYSFFGYNRFRVHSFYDKDYLDRADKPVKTKLLQYLKNEGINSVKDVYLVTQAKYFGMIFNPVSFYFCFNSKAANAELVCMVCEVNNTFNERHLYILKRKDLQPVKLYEFKAKKAFHVSPFNNLKGEYHFRFADIKKKLDVGISLHREEGNVFFARLDGLQEKIEKKKHSEIVFKYPLGPLLVVPRIFYQALKLFVFKHLKYYDKPVPESRMTILKNRPTWLQRKLYKIMDSMFAEISSGCLTLTLPEGEVKKYGTPGNGGRTTSIIINDWAFFKKVAFDGDVGFGEAYVEGIWTTDNLSGLLMMFLDNYHIFKPENFSAALLTRFIGRLRYLSQKNSIKGSRKNIHAHYDLSNDFYKLFLDQSMLYSAGIFLSARDSLRKAQLNKVHAIIQKAGITKKDHVLEIGCGWGGFAVEAVKKTGCRVTAITVSKEQYEYAQEVIQKSGIAGKIDLKLCDYRHIEGTYSKVVSIEMAEAVGHQYLGEYLETIDTVLDKDGVAVLQVITMPDHRHDQYKKEYDWIKKHIFPGGHLPCISEISTLLKQRTELFIHNLENIGIHYAKTLRLWNDSFQKKLTKVRDLGFDEEFIRKWSYYLSSTEALFETRTVNNVQIVLTRPNNYSID